MATRKSATAATKNNKKSSKSAKQKASASTAPVNENDVQDQDEDEDDFEDIDDSDEAEASAENESNDSNSSDSAPRRKRGRPKGVKAGPRQIVYLCIGVIDGELVTQRISPPEDAPEETKLNFSAEEAKKLFAEEQGEEPGAVEGPFYDVKGKVGGVKPSKRMTVSMDIDDIRLSTVRHKGILNGWYGIAHELENNPDAVLFMFSRQVDASEKKKAPPPAKVFKRSAVEFVD